jgi:tetratricopeptide (TPR) repeat protein
MQATGIVIVSVLSSAAVATAVAFAMRSPAAAEPGSPTVGVDEFRAAVQRLEAAQEKLQQRLAALPASAPSGDSARTELPTLRDDQIGAAVERYLAGRAAGGRAVEAADTSGTHPLDLQAAFAEMRGKGNIFDNPDAWRRVSEAGKLDEMLAMFEQYAAANPNDPQAQMDLADAYLSCLQLDQSKGPTLGMKLDGTYDKVLALDENHWKARFSKAVGYTFWPDFLGKKTEAMAHFERLMTQQESMPPTDEQAQTYLFLGNLLEQRGETAKAREVWQKGARRHPGNAELRRKLGG